MQVIAQMLSLSRITPLALAFAGRPLLPLLPLGVSLCRLLPKDTSTSTNTTLLSTPQTIKRELSSKMYIGSSAFGAHLSCHIDGLRDRWYRGSRARAKSPLRLSNMGKPSLRTLMCSSFLDFPSPQYWNYMATLTFRHSLRLSTWPFRLNAPDAFINVKKFKGGVDISVRARS